MDSALALLGLLSHEPSYGYDLKQSYDRFFGLKKPLAFGQVYSTLARLARDGFVSAADEASGAGPDRKRYDVTPAGRDRLVAWMYTPDPPSDLLQTNLFAKTVVALLVDQDAERLLDIQRAEHLAWMRDLTRRKQGADLMHVMLYDHALFHLEADLRWIELTGARLRQLREEITAG